MNGDTPRCFRDRFSTIMKEECPRRDLVPRSNACLAEAIKKGPALQQSLKDSFIKELRIILIHGPIEALRHPGSQCICRPFDSGSERLLLRGIELIEHVVDRVVMLRLTDTQPHAGEAVAADGIDYRLQAFVTAAAALSADADASQIEIQVIGDHDDI